MAGRSTLVLVKYANKIVISSQMCVFVCVYPLHGRDLATCTCELTRFSISQDNNCIVTQSRIARLVFLETRGGELAVQAVYKGTGAKGGWNGGKDPSWSVQKYFNSGKDEKKERNVLKRDSGPGPEARQEEKGKRKAAKVTPEFAGAVGKLIVSRGVVTGV